jgi:hypothetical protein
MNRLILSLLFSAATTSFAMSSPVNQLPTACKYNGAFSAKTYDSTSGVCRTIKYATAGGEVQLLVCDKGDHYELYRQSAPASGTLKACTGAGCVDQLAGFASFTGTSLPADMVQTTTPPPLVDPNSTGFAGQTRAQNHATLVDAWWNNTAVVQTLTCPTGSCAWVPWYTSSTSCSTLHDCNIPGGPTATQNCMVTDEFSQVFLVTAQGENESRVQQLVRMLDAIDNTASGLPAWKVKRNGNTLDFSQSDNGNSASDADARILIALYTAANSSYFSASAKVDFRTRADALAANFLANDFRNEPRGGITYWLAGGANQKSGGLNSSGFTYAGYYGDAVLALLAAYRSTGNTNYRTAAQDTVSAYLLAANFNGSSFSVPPIKFHWDTSYTPPHPVCEDYCADWGYDDAPRATSMCKAKYAASLAGVTLPSALDAYCQSWMNSGGITSTEFKPKYTLGGTPLDGFQTGAWENGLAAALNFVNNTGDLPTRLNRVGQHYVGGSGIWDDPNLCYGVYRNAIFPANLGSAIGRDLAAFTAP